MSTPNTLRNFLDGHFNETNLNEPYQLVRELQRLYPNSVHIPVVDQFFPVGQFLKENNIPVKGHRSETLTTYILTMTGSGTNMERDVNPRDICGLTSFSYKGTDFWLYKVEIEASGGGCGPPGRNSTTFWNFVYDKPAGVDLMNVDAVGKGLIKDVYDWMHRPDDNKIWVFDRGQWYQDQELTEAVESASWDNLVLEESFVKGLQRDTSTFFSSEKIYKSLGITWKRGILLLGGSPFFSCLPHACANASYTIGPPGNGKTESLKALINTTPQKALYVKSFNSTAVSLSLNSQCVHVDPKRQGSEFAVRQIFEHARRFAPCVLIIEDIDSMVTQHVKSFFLNELDGLVQNQGVLTIATTNHPERIDDAILNRPSRFDVKYDFALPSEPLRKQFASKWIKKARNSANEVENLFARTDDDAIAGDIAKRTEGWSFAFLKEL